MESLVQTALTVIVSSVMGAIVSAIMSWLKSQKAMDDGLRALLWRELKDVHSQAMSSGGLNIDDRKHLESVYEAYHSRGGNGTGTRLYEESMAQPVLD